MNHSEFEANTCNRRQAKQKPRVSTIGLASHKSIIKRSKENQSKHETTFDTIENRCK